MANITIQNLEVESTALNQVSPGEMEKVIGGNNSCQGNPNAPMGGAFFDIGEFNTSVALFFGISGYLAFLELIDTLV
ncbi:hypothetical protein NWP22_10880 [Anabaenopsis tanganyikae CS-531]|uniref:Bacteriocin-type signal sequence n=1 Tax=Anabaenopsis tanganyikae CS-531 TaxID=2785304 RepID=A0ABT6KEQ9_9CYAN|nr:hypothetical protein [Anabaenopsis tanganyikae]MDH6106365.1 hypothetical protein [Anabaenopsis tanganyikae CS-531]